MPPTVWDWWWASLEISAVTTGLDHTWLHGRNIVTSSEFQIRSLGSTITTTLLGHTRRASTRCQCPNMGSESPSQPSNCTNRILHLNKSRTYAKEREGNSLYRKKRKRVSTRARLLKLQVQRSDCKCVCFLPIFCGGVLMPYSPRKTIATAQSLYHRFHLFFPRKDFNSFVCVIL